MTVRWSLLARVGSPGQSFSPCSSMVSQCQSPEWCGSVVRVLGYPKYHTPLTTTAVRVSRCVCAWMTVFGATCNWMVYRPAFVGSANSTRVVTARNPDVPAPALSLGSASISRSQTSLRLTVLSRRHRTQGEERHAQQWPRAQSIQIQCSFFRNPVITAIACCGCSSMIQCPELAMTAP